MPCTIAPIPPDDSFPDIAPISCKAFCPFCNTCTVDFAWAPDEYTYCSNELTPSFPVNAAVGITAANLSGLIKLSSVSLPILPELKPIKVLTIVSAPGLRIPP